MATPVPRTYGDVNAVVGSYLRDLAFAQSSKRKMFGYKRAAAAVLALDVPLTELLGSDGALPKIAGIGPGSTRIVREVLETGESATVERAIEQSGNRADIERRRRLRGHFLSRAEVRRVLADPAFEGPTLHQYRGESPDALGMERRQSNGERDCRRVSRSRVSLRGRQRSFLRTEDCRRHVDGAGSGTAKSHRCGQFDAWQSVQTAAGNRSQYRAAGRLDLSDHEAATFDVVLAAPHSRLRRAEDQTDRLLTAIAQPSVRILAHPRGRITGSRAGVVADWDAVFASAARRGVAIEIDGDPARQDLDYSLACRALGAGCLFALDSDPHTVGQLSYAEIALAHARLASIPASRIINCWPLEQLLVWLADPGSAS